MAMPQQDSTFSARDLAEILFRHKRKLVLFPTLTLLVGTMAILFWPRTYRSEAKLFLQVGRESVGLDPTATTGQTIALQQSGRDDEVKSAIDVLSSRAVIARAVDAVGPDLVLGRTGVGVAESNPFRAAMGAAAAMVGFIVKNIDPISDREQAIVQVERKMHVDAERNSTVIVVRFDATTPRLAQIVCDALVRAYKDEHMRIHRNADSGLFFENQKDLLRTQLDKAIEQVRDAKNEMGVANVESRRATLESQRSAIELEIYTSEQNLATSQARVVEMRSQLEHIPERLVSSKRSVPNEGRDLKSDQFYALQVKAGDLKARFSSSHPLVVAIDQQIREAEALLDTETDQRLETTDDVNPIHRELLLELKQQRNVVSGLEARLKRLRQQQKSLLTELRQINQYEVTLDQLEREAHLARNKFYQYADSMEQARVDQMLAKQSISNVSIAQAATHAEKPVSPSKMLLSWATLAIALGGTLSLMIVSERLDDLLRNEREVEDGLQIPVFVAIPADSAPSYILAS